MPQPVGGRRHAIGPGGTGGGAPVPAGLNARLRGALIEGLDLPGEIVFDLPRITLLGQLQLTVENHRGLLEFLPERVAIGTRDGLLVVLGRDLRLGVVRDGEITVTGLLTEVRFERPGAGP